MLKKLKQLEHNPGTFNIINNNCAENALKVLNSGGINPNHWYDFGLDSPQGLGRVDIQVTRSQWRVDASWTKPRKLRAVFS
jgi:hypothetical protein